MATKQRNRLAVLVTEPCSKNKQGIKPHAI